MKFADHEYKTTWNYLYDKNESLFYRDDNYFSKREKNGNKMFWGRGNGWVIAGLVEILKTLPTTDSEYKPFYINLLKEMSSRLLSLQRADGSWSASLLDSDSYPDPESSATGLIIYGLAYGINQGYLDKDKYFPAIEKGWKILTQAVNTEGKLGWIQPVGENPKNVTKKMTEMYGPGAFLMAASEIYKSL